MFVSARDADARRDTRGELRESPGIIGFVFKWKTYDDLLEVEM